MVWPLIAVFFIWLGLNVLASFAVLRKTELPANKRSLQLVLVWLLPVIGAVVCLAFVLTDTRDSRPSLDKTAFVENADASGPDMVGPGICGCSDSGGGGDGGD